MPGILPEVAAGAVVIRDGAGVCLAPPDVMNAYCPPPEFTSTCELTAIPSTCEGRIEPRQINAIVSELMSFVQCMVPDYNWNCASLNNLCTAFTAWNVNDGTVDGISIVGAGTMADPYTVGTIDCGEY